MRVNSFSRRAELVLHSYFLLTALAVASAFCVELDFSCELLSEVPSEALAGVLSSGADLGAGGTV